MKKIYLALKSKEIITSCGWRGKVIAKIKLIFVMKHNKDKILM